MNTTEQLYTYDNSFFGFLTVIHTIFKDDSTVQDIRSTSHLQNGLFTEIRHVDTNTSKAKQVWYAIQKKNYHAAKTIYFAFLSESHGMEMLLYKYIRQLFSKSKIPSTYLGNEDLLKIEQMSGMVGREKRRLESNIELKQVFSYLRLAYIEPDFNVLPLLSKHFRSVHRDQSWLVIDRKRSYGIYSDGGELEMVSLKNIKTILAQHRLLQKDEQPVSTAILHKHTVPAA